MFKLYWIREDGQGDYDMGEYATEDEAKAAIPSMEAELIDQCPYPHREDHKEFVVCRDEILAGKWSVDEQD